MRRWEEITTHRQALHFIAQAIERGRDEGRTQEETIAMMRREVNQASNAAHRLRVALFSKALNNPDDSKE